MRSESLQEDFRYVPQFKFNQDTLLRPEVMPLTRSRFYSVVIIAVVLGLAFKTYRLDASIEIAAPPNVVKEKVYSLF